NVELYRVTLDTQSEQLSAGPPGAMHYHPAPSSDGKWLAYGSKRDGVRQLYVMRLSDKREWRITDLAKGRAAMWPSWQPAAKRPWDGGWRGRNLVPTSVGMMNCTGLSLEKVLAGSAQLSRSHEIKILAAGCRFRGLPIDKYENHVSIWQKRVHRKERLMPNTVRFHRVLRATPA